VPKWGRSAPASARSAAGDTLRLVDGVSGILFSEALAAEGAIVFAKACELGLEGIVSKRQEPPLAEHEEPEFRQDVIAMSLDWRAIFDRTSATARLIVSRVVSRFANSVIRPNGQRDHPRLIGCQRQGLEQVRFISSQAQEAVLSDLTAIVLEALHQFAGPRARANAFHIRASC
jgi:hypothetical protein